MSSPYLTLNPFLDTSVGEAELWGTRDWLDVPQIHAPQFGDLTAALEAVRGSHRTQVRFVRGPGGSGKSHLFARLRRQCADSIFYAYASNPPLQSGALEGFILSRLIASLRQPARLPNGMPAHYTQLRLLAYALIKPVIEQDLPIHELHEAWARIPLEDRKALLHEALLMLEADHPQMPRSALRALLTVLREDKEHLAAQWLAGASYLTEGDLKFLGVSEPLRQQDTGLVIQLLGRLSSRVDMPFVLVLDQLDLISTAPQLDEFQRLLFALIDQSENWLVFIGLVVERFAEWDMSLSQALRGRIGVPDLHASLGFRLPVTDVLPIATEEKTALLTSRLQNRALETQRTKDRATSPLHPLTDAEINRLTSGGAIFPRHLLAAASEAFIRCAGNGAIDTPTTGNPPALPAAAAPVRTPPMLVATPTAATSAPIPPPRPIAAPPPLPPAMRAPALTAAPAVPPPIPVAHAPAKPTSPKPPLAAKLDELMRAAMLSGNSETPAENAVDLGERVRDLIQLMAGMPVEVREGDMSKSYTAFDGADYQAAWGGGQVRIVTTDAVRNSLLAVMERLEPVAGGTLLLRHAAAPLSGQLTLEKMAAFSQRNVFHHMPASESAVLGALGRVLASMREGSLDDLQTEPPSTRQNILNTLRQHPLLRSLKSWDLITKMMEPGKSPLSAIIQGGATAPTAGPPQVAVPFAVQLPSSATAPVALAIPMPTGIATAGPIKMPPAPPAKARPAGLKPIQPPTPPTSVAPAPGPKPLAPISRPVAKPVRPPMDKTLPPPSPAPK